MEELEKMSLVELRKYGKKLGMRNATTYKKKDLVEEIQKIVETQGKKESKKSSVEKKEKKSVKKAAAKPAPEPEKTSRKKNVRPEGEVSETSSATEEITSKISSKPAGTHVRKMQSRGTASRVPEENTPAPQLLAKQPIKNIPVKKSAASEGREPRMDGYRGRKVMERRQDRRPESEERGSAGSYGSQRMEARSGHSSGYAEAVGSVHEETRHYGNRDERYNSGSRDDRYNNRDERYSNRNDRYSSREDRYASHDDRNNRDDHYTPHVNLRGDAATMAPTELAQIDSGETKQGILEVMPEGYGFVRCDNYLPGDEDVYVSPAMIRRFGLRTGDILEGNTRIRNQNEKFSALLYINTVNGYALEESMKRAKFENLTPVFPNEKIHLEVKGAKNNISMRMMDLISPIGKGQRGMIVSQPKTGKTTLLKQVAKAVTHNHPGMHLIVLLIDERPEEVTDIKESIQGDNVEVIYSTFDELPENHRRVSEMVIGRAKRLVEHGEDVMILLDSITRLARAYNLTVQPSGRTLSGGLDPAALHMPKRFFGAARNMREGGSLTILATALVDTGSKMDDVVFEEFKGTGNMEMVLDRRLSEKRLFPAIDLPKSSTRRDDLLLEQEELEANFLIRKAFNGAKSDEAVENIIAMFRKTKDNAELVQLVKKVKIVP